MFQNPRPVFDDVRKRYGQDYFTYELTNERNFFGLMRLGLRDIRFSLRAAALPLPRTFLDIGCATGMLIESMKKEGWGVTGVDVCKESAEYGLAHRGVDIFPGTLEEARFPDELVQRNPFLPPYRACSRPAWIPRRGSTHPEARRLCDHHDAKCRRLPGAAF